MLPRLILALALLKIPRLIFNLLRSIILIAWMLVVGGLAILFRIVTPSADNRLRDLDQAIPQGLLTEGVPCPRCHRLNTYEAHTCFSCGSYLAFNTQHFRIPSRTAIVLGIVLAVVLSLLLLSVR